MVSKVLHVPIAVSVSLAYLKVMGKFLSPRRKLKLKQRHDDIHKKAEIHVLYYANSLFLHFATASVCVR